MKQTLKDVDIKDYNLKFRKNKAKMKDIFKIIVHHTGNPVDDDLSAKQIHNSHLAQGWAGIGYHFVVRKNGTIERGRPIQYMGSHARGVNNNTIGVMVAGNFEIAKPTNEQIENLAVLCAGLCNEYKLEPHKAIFGHRDIGQTACPGQNLYNLLDRIKGKTIWYMEHGW